MMKESSRLGEPFENITVFSYQSSRVSSVELTEIWWISLLVAGTATVLGAHMVPP